MKVHDEHDEKSKLTTWLGSRISRREFLGVSAATLGALALTHGCGGGDSSNANNTQNNPNANNTQNNPNILFNKPNILFILTDNQPTWMLGCYGSETVETPHIDRLAAEGMRFTNAFACNGLCSPTRATLMTGLLPSQHGIHDWISDDFINYKSSDSDPSEPWPPIDWCAVREFRTLPVTLANRGYQTAQIGKYHMGRPRAPMPGFQSWITFPYGHTLDFYRNTILDNGRAFDQPPGHIVEYFAQRGVEFLRNYDGRKPFYLQLNFDGPYLLPPTNVGPDYSPYNKFYNYYAAKFDFHDWPQYDLDPYYVISYDLMKCALKPGDFNCSMFGDIIRMGKKDQPDYYTSRANTASQNAIVDSAVGMVMQALEETGLDGNTIVIFATDQACYYGQTSGQGGMYGHTNFRAPARLHDCVMNIPLIFRCPGTIPANQVNHDLIGQYDIMSTILDLAGFGSVPIDHSPGRSFAPFLDGRRIDDWHDAVFFEQEETRGLRTATYAYWKNRGFGPPTEQDVPPIEEASHLFHMDDKQPDYDPEQIHNLAGKGLPIEDELDGKLKAFFDQYVNPHFDLWGKGKTKSPTERTDMMNGIYRANWETDKTPWPPFVDTVEVE